MARYIGPTCKLARREGTDLFLKSGAKPLESKCKLQVPPGGIKGERRQRLSDYGMQLREKQKLRRMYGVLERQFRNYYQAAARRTGATGETLLKLLGVAPGQRGVPHGICGHARRGAPAGRAPRGRGQRPDRQRAVVPVSRRRGDPDPREAPASSCASPSALAVAAQVGFPEWVEVNDKEFRGVFKTVPGRDEVLPDINENLVVELYSK